MLTARSCETDALATELARMRAVQRLRQKWSGLPAPSLKPLRPGRQRLVSEAGLTLFAHASSYRYR